MATRVNALDHLPNFLITPLRFVSRMYEDPVGLARPLWRDYSRWDGLINMAIARANGVMGYVARAGISWGYQDPWFPRNWSEGGAVGLYRSSYHVIYPSEDVIRQADNWYQVHPTLEYIPRCIDLELSTDQPAGRIAEKVYEMSNVVLLRDGVRPIIYSRYLLINEWLASWTTDMLNDHYWWLAQYPYVRTNEHPGPPTLPDRVRRDRVVLHQTCDKKPAFVGEVDRVCTDWDRWKIGNEVEMHMWITDNWGGNYEPPPPSEPNELLMTCLQDGLRVRRTPSTSGLVVRELEYGDTVHALEVHGSDAWVEIGTDEYVNVKLSSDRNMQAQ